MKKKEESSETMETKPSDRVAFWGTNDFWPQIWSDFVSFLLFSGKKNVKKTKNS